MKHPTLNKLTEEEKLKNSLEYWSSYWFITSYLNKLTGEGKLKNPLEYW